VAVTRGPTLPDHEKSHTVLHKRKKSRTVFINTNKSHTFRHWHNGSHTFRHCHKMSRTSRHILCVLAGQPSYRPRRAVRCQKSLVLSGLNAKSHILFAPSRKVLYCLAWVQKGATKVTYCSAAARKVTRSLVLRGAGPASNRCTQNSRKCWPATSC
jgi:hypothetical protein